jgi:hypothetical protein
MNYVGQAHKLEEYVTSHFATIKQSDKFVLDSVRTPLNYGLDRRSYIYLEGGSCLSIEYLGR